WKQANHTFIGSKGPANATISTAWDDKHLYIAYSVLDPSLAESPNRAVDQSDGIAVMLATNWLASDSLTSGTYKIYATSSGKTAARQGKNGLWIDYDLSVEVSGTTSDRNGYGYQLELGIPWSEIGGKPNVNEGWGINFELMNYNSSTNHLYRENISGNIEERPSTWSKIQLVQ